MVLRQSAETGHPEGGPVTNRQTHILTRRAFSNQVLTKLCVANRHAVCLWTVRCRECEREGATGLPSSIRCRLQSWQRASEPARPLASASSGNRWRGCSGRLLPWCRWQPAQRRYALHPRPPTDAQTRRKRARFDPNKKISGPPGVLAIFRVRSAIEDFAQRQGHDGPGVSPGQ